MFDGHGHILAQMPSVCKYSRPEISTLTHILSMQTIYKYTHKINISHGYSPVRNIHTLQFCSNIEWSKQKPERNGCFGCVWVSFGKYHYIFRAWLLSKTEIFSTFEYEYRSKIYMFIQIREWMFRVCPVDLAYFLVLHLIYMVTFLIMHIY